MILQAELPNSGSKSAQATGKQHTCATSAQAAPTQSFELLPSLEPAFLQEWVLHQIVIIYFNILPQRYTLWDDIILQKTTLTNIFPYMKIEVWKIRIGCLGILNDSFNGPYGSIVEPPCRRLNPQQVLGGYGMLEYRGLSNSLHYFGGSLL